MFLFILASSFLSSISSNDASFRTESKNDSKSPKDSPDDDNEINSYSDDFEVILFIFIKLI